jgi:hypothetical protein
MYSPGYIILPTGDMASLTEQSNLFTGKHFYLTAPFYNHTEHLPADNYRKLTMKKSLIQF